MHLFLRSSVTYQSNNTFLQRAQEHSNVDGGIFIYGTDPQPKLSSSQGTLQTLLNILIEMRVQVILALFHSLPRFKNAGGLHIDTAIPLLGAGLAGGAQDSTADARQCT